MREIKFRGMGINGEWYYGNLSIIKQRIKSMGIDPGSYISNKAGVPFAYRVRPETIGQYTVLKDKNGREIYEGDIVRITSEDDEEEFNICEVKFSDGAFQVDVSGLSSDYDVTAVGWVEYATIEVIGDVYQNPELLDSK
ncbi:YopX family protein [Bacillus subtilis]